MGEGEEVSIKLTFEGPRVVDARLALRQAVAAVIHKVRKQLKNLILAKGGRINGNTDCNAQTGTVYEDGNRG